MSPETVYCPPIDVDAEEVFPAFDASRYHGRPSKSAIQRWIHDGIIDRTTGNRKKLATVRIGGRIFTSLQAIRRFNAGSGAPAYTPTQVRKQAAAAMAALEAAGV